MSMTTVWVNCEPSCCGENTFRYTGCLVAVPEHMVLTYMSELVPHLRPGTTVSTSAFPYRGGDDSHDDWRFTCT